MGQACDIETLLRPDVAAMEEYTPILPFEVLSARLGLPPERIVKLDANENPYGPSPKTLAALAAFPYHNIYPDPEQTALRAGLSRYLGIPADRILAGAGADELLDLICRLFLYPGDAVIVCPPTFGMYRFDALIQGARVVEISRRDDFTLDLDAIEKHFVSPDDAHPPKIVFLTSPNNPDGGLISQIALRRLLRLPAVIVMDEAYTEFAGESALMVTHDHSNLIVLRTFSKWAGLAGLRAGYGVFPAAVMRHLWKIKQPYNVSTAATVAALASLDDLAYLHENVRRLIAERERLQRELGRFDFLQPFPSRANFVLCRVIGRDARFLKQSLERRGILVRFFDRPGLRSCIRVSVGKPEHTDALLTSLREV
ncbi:MAG: histidinol-phosphate transaminase [Anaerolineae bacterium]|nr:histidinol-phosphate transaminase [Anaerolineae bacterium]